MSSTQATDAIGILAKMHDTYRNAKSYADNTTVVFYAIVRSSGTAREEAYTKGAIEFERPNKLRMAYNKYFSSNQAENYLVVSNGTILRSQADELPDQIHEAVAPPTLLADNFLPEPALRGAVLENSLENTFPQLAMLLASDAQQGSFPGEAESRLLSDEKLAGRSYHRLSLPSPAGNRVLWIDKQDFTLRRMEIPIDDQREQLNSQGYYSSVSVWIDFEQVEINKELADDTFVLEVPKGVNRVRRFVPPPPSGPPEYLGQPVGEFAFEALDGEAVTPQTLRGKVVALDFWSTVCPPCRTQTPVLNEVYEHFKETDDVEFLAVSLDKSPVTNDVVERTLREWGGQMPVVRDLQSTGVRELNIRQTPSLVMLDRESRLQVFQVGAHQTSKPLIDAIQRLVDGEDIVANDRATHADFVLKYQQAIEAASIKDSIIPVESARAKAETRKLPEKLTLKQLWQTSADQVKQPGYVQLIKRGQSNAYQLLVLDEGQAIIELDSEGNRIERYELPEHSERTGGFLRSWANDDGQRLTLASGVGWQQVYVFDQAWQLLLAFPDEQHAGIGDVLVADLAESGTPVMCVGYQGGLGVQGGSLDGRQLWTNGILDYVFQVGLGPTTADGAKSIWCTSTRGTLIQLATDGKSTQERYLDGQAIMYFASQPDGESHCGLSIGKVGQYMAVGFDSESDAPTWEYPLPEGEYAEHVPRIHPFVLPNGQQAWLMVAANGSLQWLNSTGQLIDRFDYGDIVTGLTTAVVANRVLLFVSTAKSLTAWEVGFPEQTAAPDKPSKSAQSAKASTSESDVE